MIAFTYSSPDALAATGYLFARDPITAECDAVLMSIFLFASPPLRARPNLTLTAANLTAGIPPWLDVLAIRRTSIASLSVRGRSAFLTKRFAHKRVRRLAARGGAEIGGGLVALLWASPPTQAAGKVARPLDVIDLP